MERKRHFLSRKVTHWEHRVNYDNNANRGLSNNQQTCHTFLPEVVGLNCSSARAGAETKTTFEAASPLSSEPAAWRSSGLGRGDLPRAVLQPAWRTDGQPGPVQLPTRPRLRVSGEGRGARVGEQLGPRCGKEGCGGTNVERPTPSPLGSVGPERP